MGKQGNFLQYAESKLGVDVGFGKMILVYGEKTSLSASDLTADAINAAISSGEIIGIIKGWHTVAGAPVAEINVERTSTAEMKLIRSEIAADTLTFENNLVNNEVINDLVKLGTVDGALLDDQGKAFGDYSPDANKISTMKINFSGKTTSSFQRDNTTEKTVDVTVRYLVKDVSYLDANVETELIESKELVYLQYVSSTTTAGTTSLVLRMKSKFTGLPFAGSILAADITARIKDASVSTATYNAADGTLTIGLTSAGSQLASGQNVAVEILGDTLYSKEYTFTLTA